MKAAEKYQYIISYNLEIRLIEAANWNVQD